MVYQKDIHSTTLYIGIVHRGIRNREGVGKNVYIYPNWFQLSVYTTILSPLPFCSLILVSVVVHVGMKYPVAANAEEVCKKSLTGASLTDVLSA